MKHLLILFCSIIMIAGSTAAILMLNKSNPLVETNVKVLMDYEVQPGFGYNICYYESTVKIGYTYYDCGKCEKVYDEQGKGKYSKCTKQ